MPLHFRFLLVLALACVLSACGSTARVEPTDTDSDTTEMVEEQSPTEEIAIAPTDAPAPTAAAHTLQESPAKDVYAAGDTARVGDFLVRVNNITTKTTSDTGTPKAGNQYLLVDVTLENHGKEPISIAALLQMLVRADSNEYPLSIDASTDIMGVNGSIAPGQASSGVVGYEVPEALANAQWVFRTVAPDTSAGLKETGRVAFSITK